VTEACVQIDFLCAADAGDSGFSHEAFLEEVDAFQVALVGEVSNGEAGEGNKLLGEGLDSTLHNDVIDKYTIK
jgi:hypothetical protein